MRISRQPPIATRTRLRQRCLLCVRTVHPENGNVGSLTAQRMSRVTPHSPSLRVHLPLWICFAMGCASAPTPAQSTQRPPLSPAQSPSALSALRASLRDSLHGILGRARSDSAFPGAYAVVGNHAGILAEESVGHLDWGPSAVPDEHSLWDLASLTKVVGMTTAVMQLSEQNKIDLDAPLQRYFPDWQGPHKELVTIRHLITHTSGLPAFRAYDQQTHDADSVARLMFSTPLDTLPGVRMLYS